MTVTKKDIKPAPASSVMQTNNAFEAYESSGLEGLTAKDLLIPRLTILQDLSPQIKEKKSEYIEGAKVSNICDVATQEIFDGEKGVHVLLVEYIKQYIEWAPRSSGRGLINIYTDESILDRCTRDEKNRTFLDNGNLLQETAQFFVYNLTSGRPSPAFIAMSSTQLKRARGWMHLANSEVLHREDGSEFKPPLFYRTYHLKSVMESNNDGEWYGWKVDRGQSLPEYAPNNWQNYLNRAVEFRDSIRSGQSSADMQSDDEGNGQETSM